MAIFITWHEIKRGHKYGINTIQRAELKKFTINQGDIGKSSPYEAVNYYMLETLLEKFRKLFPEEKNLLDVGSGKGRVMVTAAHYGFKKITGVDFAKELHPIWIEKIPMKTMGQPEDIAEAVLYLASPKSKYVTGADWIIDGGYTVP